MIESGIIYQWISAISQSISVIIMNVCLDFILTGREERGPRRKRIGIWITVTVISIFFKCFASVNGIFYTIINPMLLMLFYVFMAGYFYQDKLWIRATHVSMIIIQNTLADAILYAVMGEIHKFSLFADKPFSNPYMAERCILVGIISISFNMIYITIVQRRKKVGEAGANPVWIAAILPAFFVSFSFWWKQEVQYASEGSKQYMIILTVWMCLQFVVAMVYLSYLQKREMQEEAARLSRAIALEQIRYEQIEVRREELAKLRHDYNNILASVLFLLKSERNQEARKVIVDLLSRVEDTEKSECRGEEQCSKVD